MDLREIGTPALAYLGDSVIELLVRRMLVESGCASSRQLNLSALSYVTAGAQAGAVARILPLLTEEEELVYRRGRNIGHTNVPKKATVAQYRMATGFEVLFGYLYLAGKEERAKELFRHAYAPETVENCQSTTKKGNNDEQSQSEN